MRVQKRVSVLLVALVVLMALASVTPVQAVKPHRWWCETSVNQPPWSPENPTWAGDVWTEDGKHGTFYWYNEESFLLGPADSPKVMKLWGIWWACFDDGSCIQGTHDGSFTYAINQYTINGRVSVATNQWQDLVGRKVHTVGEVDWTGGIYGYGYSESVFQINQNNETDGFLKEGGPSAVQARRSNAVFCRMVEALSASNMPTQSREARFDSLLDKSNVSTWNLIRGILRLALLSRLACRLYPS